MLIQGRIHQIEYAMEAVKQGSATVGLKSRTHAVLVALKVQSFNVLFANLSASQKIATLLITTFKNTVLYCIKTTF